MSHAMSQPPSKSLTPAELEASMRGLERHIRNYARLAICKGAALKPGQELVINGPIERADFIRLLVKTAYEEGAGHVSVLWSDDELSRLEYEHMDVSYYETIPSWKREQLNSFAKDGAAFLFVAGSDPMALSGIDPAKPATRSKSISEQCRTYREGLDFGRNTWSVIGAPVASWATTVFPGVSADEAVYRLWAAILEVSRAMGPDPLGAWELHNATFEKNKRLLNGYAFEQLRYRSSNGTDLVIGMNKGHAWHGGAGRTVEDRVFFPNIPTEEVFTSPDRMRADGIVHSVLPLVYAGQIVRDFWLRFENGCVVDYDAQEGRDVLTSILQTDENSCRLGECALIAKDTPIRQSGILFYNTLYDENASCHLALGTGFPECIENGFELDKDELLARGLNRSLTHVDFMIGADDLEVIGVTPQGEEVPVFTDGRWAWSVE